MGAACYACKHGMLAMWLHACMPCFLLACVPAWRACTCPRQVQHKEYVSPPHHPLIWISYSPTTPPHRSLHHRQPRHHTFQRHRQGPRALSRQRHLLQDPERVPVQRRNVQHFRCIFGAITCCLQAPIGSVLSECGMGVLFRCSGAPAPSFEVQRMLLITTPTLPCSTPAANPPPLALPLLCSNAHTAQTRLMLSVLHLSYPGPIPQNPPACSVNSDAFANQSMTMMMGEGTLVYNNTVCSMVSTTKYLSSAWGVIMNPTTKRQHTHERNCARQFQYAKGYVISAMQPLVCPMLKAVQGQ